MLIKSPHKKAEELLKGFLNDAQYADWKQSNCFNVRGSDGRLYRIIAEHPSPYNQGAVVNQNGERCNVWPVNLDIPADRALAMLLYLGHNARHVWGSGCHDYHVPQLPDDYSGMI